MTYAEKMSEFFANLRYEDIPAAKMADVKTILLDYIACIYGGTKTKSGRIAAKFARDFNETGKCTLLGFGYKTAPYNAAFCNAIMGHSTEMDDVDVLAYFHNAPQTISAALAAAEWSGATGKEFLVGMAAGFEALNRISEACNPGLRARGFHTTACVGAFGAGIAAAKTMGLSAEQMVNTLGLSGAQASGLLEFYGTSMAKRFNPGPAARNGVTAALFAERGFTGAETIFEGKFGFFKAHSAEYDPEKLIKDLGKDWRFVFEYKPYACARPIHNAIDCALNIRKDHRPKLEEIAAIVIKRHPEWGTYYHNIKEPLNYHMAQVSVQFAAALALVLGKAFVDQFNDDNIADPTIMGISKMIDIEDDPSLPRGVSCNMIVTMRNGDVYQSQVDYPKGSIQVPMTEEDHRAKMSSLCAHMLDNDEQEDIIRAVRNLEQIGNISEFVQLMS
ncbi:MAG: MmgE/PrpD family protein [Peptococcaceae bacterium]|jgi:2-methylcitrate dehydratase PrpD|nr:MmgE/PrpD family protein [Peptococcaceae bacterium]